MNTPSTRIPNDATAANFTLKAVVKTHCQCDRSTSCEHPNRIAATSIEKFEVTIDIPMVSRYAQAAWDSKGRKRVDGPLTVKCTSAKPK